MKPIEVEGGGLFTDKQMDYVNSVKDKDLRATLLHQIREKEIANSFVSSEIKKQRVFIYAQDSDEQILKDLRKAKGDYIIKTKREATLNRPLIRMIEELIK